MSNRTRLEHYDADTETLDRARTALPDALRRMHDARLGHPASSTGPGGSSGSASPVERALGLNGDDGPMATDPGRAAIAAFDKMLHQLHVTAEAMHHLVSQWAPRQPDPKAKAATEVANVAECAHHRATIGTHEPMRVHSDVSGILDEPLALCDYCWRFVRRVGRLPSGSELDRVRKGQRVRLPVS